MFPQSSPSAPAPDSTFGVIFGLFFILFAFMIGFAIYSTVNASSARNNYEAALETFRNDPTNSSKKQAAEFAGTEYAKYVRYRQGASVRDEVAIRNEIEAISARAVAQTQVQQVAVAQAPNPTIADRLTTLDQLLARQLITEDEYAQRREAILAEI